MNTAADWLGREYGPGDYVLYSRSYGSGSSQMLLAEVREVRDTTVIARVLKRSRSDYGPDTGLIDSRTGKSVYYSKIHEKDPAHYIHKVTGERVEDDKIFERDPDWNGPEWAAPYLRNHKDYERVPVTYWDYVVRGPSYTTFQIRDNITKVDKEYAEASISQESL